MNELKKSISCSWRGTRIAEPKVMRGFAGLVLLTFTFLNVVATNAGAAQNSSSGSKSCIAEGSKETKFFLGSSGFDDETMSMTEGAAGPELKIGDTRIFLDPGSNVDTEAKDKRNSWCVVDPVLARKKNKSNPQEPICDVPQPPDEKGKGGEPLQIRGQGGKVIGELHAIEEKGPDGMKRIRLLLKPSNGGTGEVRNQIHITAEATDKNGKITSKMRVESRNKNDDKVNGAAEASVTGQRPKESKGNDKDPMRNLRLEACHSDYQGKGQHRVEGNSSNDETAKDLNGGFFKLRGNEVACTNSFAMAHDISGGVDNSQSACLATETGRGSGNYRPTGAATTGLQ